MSHETAKRARDRVGDRARPRARRGARGRWAMAAVVGLVVGPMAGMGAGCGGGPASTGVANASRAGATSPAPPDLATALPPGAAWVAVLRPQHWLRDSELEALLGALLPSAQGAAFRARFGAGLFELDTWVAAAYGDDRVHLLRKQADQVTADRVGLGAGSQAGAGGDLAVARGLGAPPVVPSPSRAELDWRTWVLRDRGPARTIKLAVERGRHDPALATLGPAPPDAALVVYWPVALPLPRGSDLAIALGGVSGARLTVSVAPAGQLVVRWALHGAFPKSIHGNLEAALASLAREPFGTALGLPQALPAATIDTRPATVTLEFPLWAAQVRRALLPLTEANPWRLLVAPDQVRGPGLTGPSSAAGP